MAATTTSSSCATFFNLGATEGKAAARSSPGLGCGRADGVAMWIINGVANAFFASLERCSCIRIATVEDHDGDDSNDLPLIFNDGNGAVRDGSSSGRRTRTSKEGRNGVLIYWRLIDQCRLWSCLRMLKKMVFFWVSIEWSSWGLGYLYMKIFIWSFM